jgi:ParB family chromosome partitioning protein
MTRTTGCMTRPVFYINPVLCVENPYMLNLADIVVDPELESLLPPLSDEEYTGLIGSVMRDGFTDPLIVWLNHGTLVDGHNRLRIWKDAGCDEDRAPEVHEMPFADKNAVKEWMIHRQLSRRNLTDAMRVVLSLKLKPVLEAKAKANQVRKPTDSVSQTFVKQTPVHVDKEIAKAAGVSHETVRKVETVLAEADEPTKAAMLSGETSINKAYNTVHVSKNSGNNEWYTPVEYVEAARAVLGEIDLDPASCELANTNIKAARFWTADEDGLAREWSGRVWLNPPYGQPEIADFAAKVVEEVTANRVVEAVVLVNNATETEWGQTLLARADAVCLKRGRIKFLNSAGVPANTPLQGQMFLYFGANVKKFTKEFERFGVCLK